MAALPRLTTVPRKVDDIRPLIKATALYKWIVSQMCVRGRVHVKLEIVVKIGDGCKTPEFLASICARADQDISRNGGTYMY